MGEICTRCHGVGRVIVNAPPLPVGNTWADCPVCLGDGDMGWLAEAMPPGWTPEDAACTDEELLDFGVAHGVFDRAAADKFLASLHANDRRREYAAVLARLADGETRD